MSSGIALSVSADLATRWHALAMTHLLVHATSKYAANDKPLSTSNLLGMLDGVSLFSMRLGECPVPVDLLAFKSNSVAPPRPPDLDGRLMINYLEYALLDWRTAAGDEAERASAAPGKHSRGGGNTASSAPTSANSNAHCAVPWRSFFAEADAELSRIVGDPRKYAFRGADVAAGTPASFGVEGFACAVFWLCVVLQAKAECRALRLAREEKHFALRPTGATATIATASPAGRQRRNDATGYDAEVGSHIMREALLEVLRPDALLDGATAHLGDALPADRQSGRTPNQKLSRRSLPALPDGNGTDGGHHHRHSHGHRADADAGLDADAAGSDSVSLIDLVRRVGASIDDSACALLAMLIRGDASASDDLRRRLREHQETLAQLSRRKDPPPELSLQQTGDVRPPRPSAAAAAAPAAPASAATAPQQSPRTFKKQAEDLRQRAASLSLGDALQVLCVRRVGDLDEPLLDDIASWCRRRIALWIGERFSPLAFPSRTKDPTRQYYRPYLLRSFFSVVASAVGRVLGRLFSATVTGGEQTATEAWARVRQAAADGDDGSGYATSPEVLHASLVRASVERLMVEMAALPALKVPTRRGARDHRRGTASPIASTASAANAQQQQQRRRLATSPTAAAAGGGSSLDSRPATAATAPLSLESGRRMSAAPPRQTLEQYVATRAANAAAASPAAAAAAATAAATLPRRNASRGDAEVARVMRDALVRMSAPGSLRMPER